MLILKKILNKENYIIVEMEGDNNLKDYQQALEMIDKLFWLDEEWELMKQDKKDKYWLKVKRVFYRNK